MNVNVFVPSNELKMQLKSLQHTSGTADGADVHVKVVSQSDELNVQMESSHGGSGSADVHYYDAKPAALGAASPGTASSVSRGNHVHPMPTAGDVGARPDTWTPTAEDVGARPDTWIPTAKEVGARPDTWMPTAAQVGARPDTWTPTAMQVGARPDTWIPTAKEVGARPDTWTPTAQDVGARPDTWTPTAADVGAYPVGSVYISVVSTSPASLFGGVWEQIKDAFLLSAGDDYAAGSTGGAAEITLETANLPAHAHTRGTMDITGSLYCYSAYNKGNDDYWTNAVSGAFYKDPDNCNEEGSTLNQSEKADMDSCRMVSFKASRAWTGETSYVGEGEAFSSMPPYLTVYMWKRVK